MERKKLIVRTAISGNSKSYSISLTDTGKALLKEAEGSLDLVFDQANDALTSKEYIKLEQLLKKLSLGLKSSK